LTTIDVRCSVVKYTPLGRSFSFSGAFASRMTGGLDPSVVLAIAMTTRTIAMASRTDVSR
jgi:hypothetical protein